MKQKADFIVTEFTFLLNICSFILFGLLKIHHCVSIIMYKLLYFPASYKCTEISQFPSVILRFISDIIEVLQFEY